MRPCLLLVTATALGTSACSDGLPTEPITATGDHWRSLELDDETRSYLVHVPPTLDLARPAALLIAFHGIPSTPQIMRQISEFDAVAATENLVVAYPQASRSGDWNHSCRDCSGAGLLEHDDVAFSDRIIEKMALDMRIDLRRVYVTGFSQGALMAFRIACDLSHRVAAAATVGATILEWQATHCGTSRGVPIVMIHGTDDEEFPPEGRGGGLIRSLSADEMVSHWVATNACGATAAIESLPDVAADGTRVERESYTGCAGGASVVFYRVQGGGHTWPGTSHEFPPTFGLTSQDLQASEAIAGFLLAFSL